MGKITLAGKAPPLDRWPKCALPSCPNKSCLRLKSPYCWQHTPGEVPEARDNLRETEPKPEREPTDA